MALIFVLGALLYYGIRVFIEDWKGLERSVVQFEQTKERLQEYTRQCEEKRKK